jgi:hypothetical protein
MKSVVADFLLLAGFGAIAYGFGLLWLPGGFLVGGAELALLGLAATRKPV